MNTDTQSNKKEKTTCLFTKKDGVRCSTKTEHPTGYCGKHNKTKAALGEAFVAKPKAEKESEGAFYEWQLVQATDNDEEGIILWSSPDYGLKLDTGTDLGNISVSISVEQLEQLLKSRTTIMTNEGIEVEVEYL